MDPKAVVRRGHQVENVRARAVAAELRLPAKAREVFEHAAHLRGTRGQVADDLLRKLRVFTACLGEASRQDDRLDHLLDVHAAVEQDRLRGLDVLDLHTLQWNLREKGDVSSRRAGREAMIAGDQLAEVAHVLAAEAKVAVGTSGLLLALVLL